ncbi:MAG: DUF4397 domain-containing protein [Acidimicrobiales bacterium]|nr:DUF4397 domain-containing protein [Acidimicrobiales bacterium]
MRKLIALIASALVISLFAAPAGAQSGATVMLLHGIPGVPVDVYVDGDVVVEGFEPAAMEDLSALAGATLENVAVVPAGGDPETEAVIELPSLDVPASGNWTVVAHLDAEGTPTLTPFENDTSTIAAGEGRVTIRHTAQAPAVDIVVGEDRPFTDLSNPNEVVADLPAGPLPAEIAAAGGDVLVSVADLLGAEPSVTAGVNTILYAVGSLEGDSFNLYVQTIDGLGAAPAAVPTGNSPVTDSTLPWALIAAGTLAVGAVALGGREVARNRA